MATIQNCSRRPLSTTVPAWFERKFDFTFPAEQYPNVCVRLWGTPARLEEILRKVKNTRGRIAIDENAASSQDLLHRRRRHTAPTSFLILHRFWLCGSSSALLDACEKLVDLWIG